MPGKSNSWCTWSSSGRGTSRRKSGHRFQINMPDTQVSQSHISQKVSSQSKPSHTPAPWQQSAPIKPSHPTPALSSVSHPRSTPQTQRSSFPLSPQRRTSRTPPTATYCRNTDPPHDSPSRSGTTNNAASSPKAHQCSNTAYATRMCNVSSCHG